MATINNGILGGFSGTVGTVVGGNWKGIDYMRSKGKKAKDANSPAQQEQRSKFYLVRRFLQSMSDLISIGFKTKAVGMSAANSALAYIISDAVSGAYPDFSINYPEVMVTKGSLANAHAPKAASVAAGVIAFDWLLTSDSIITSAKANDRAILVVYCEELNQTAYRADILREAESGTLNVAGFSGKRVHTWISFTSNNGKAVATSVYTGEVAVV